MTDEQKPTPSVDALAQEVAGVLARRAGIELQPAPAPVPAETPAVFKAAEVRPFPSKRVSGLVVALVTIASRRFGIDAELLMGIVEYVLGFALAAHWSTPWLAAKLRKAPAPGAIDNPEAYAAGVKAGRIAPLTEGDK